MTGQQLKNSILQMAVQGKLVPQDPNDEPASVLLERIQKEKEQLIKEGKIKKEKNPSIIFKGTDNLPYEKVGKNEPVCIADEVPFDIPDTWEWVRFCNIVNYSMGKTPPRKGEKYWNNPKHKWVSIADMIADGHITETKESISEYAADSTFKGRKSLAGTLLMSFKLTVGKVSILDIDAFHNEAIISIYPFIDDNKIMTSYLFIVMPLLSQLGETKGAIKGNTLNSNSLDKLWIPLPPLAEQKRIVDKVKTLLPHIEKYGETYSIINSLNNSFPDLLKKSILQEAVQGKLVPQDENDEPASVLLERIRAEKQKLIAEGKIKKDKHESIIFKRDNSHYEKFDGIERCIDDEIPFEIPDNWQWCRFFDIINLQSGQDLTADKYNEIENGIPYITGASNIEQGQVFINRWTQFGKSFAYKGDLLITCKGTVGTLAFLEEEKVHIARQIMAIRTGENVNRSYLKMVVETLVSTLKASAKSMIPGISRDDVLYSFFPLPPLQEQYRIVSTINSLLPIIEQL